MINPECRGGYTTHQIREILGDREDDFWYWMRGQTMMVCGGQGGCDIDHGLPIVYAWDLERYLVGGPIVD